MRTAFGWLPTGFREFGIGQGGSILSIVHIGYYLDLLIRQQNQETAGVHVRHSQDSGNIELKTVAFVDDVVDLPTSVPCMTQLFVHCK